MNGAESRSEDEEKTTKMLFLVMTPLGHIFILSECIWFTGAQFVTMMTQLLNINKVKLLGASSPSSEPK